MTFLIFTLNSELGERLLSVKGGYIKGSRYAHLIYITVATVHGGAIPLQFKDTFILKDVTFYLKLNLIRGEEEREYFVRHGGKKELVIEQETKQIND